MDYTLVSLQNTYCFLDDIITVSKGSKPDHLSYVTKCLKKLDEDNLRIILQKCHFAKTEIEWLGYKFTQSGISPLQNKTAAILALPPPSTLKRLRSFFGSVNYKNNSILILAQLCHPIRPLLNISVKFLWTEKHNKHFNAIKDKIAAITENSHYNPKQDVRVKCDASLSRLEAALDQNTSDRWKPRAFASRFLNPTEERYKVNELELLRVVYNSRLSRWIDRLIPYYFTIEHMPGAKRAL